MRLMQVGWIKATLINRVIIHGKAGQSKEVTLDYALIDEKIEDGCCKLNHETAVCFFPDRRVV